MTRNAQSSLRLTHVKKLYDAYVKKMRSVTITITITRKEKLFQTRVRCFQLYKIMRAY